MGLGVRWERRAKRRTVKGAVVPPAGWTRNILAAFTTWNTSSGVVTERSSIDKDGQGRAR